MTSYCTLEQRMGNKYLQYSQTLKDTILTKLQCEVRQSSEDSYCTFRNEILALYSILARITVILSDL